MANLTSVEGSGDNFVVGDTLTFENMDNPKPTLAIGTVELSKDKEENLTGKIDSITITDKGLFYLTAPKVTITGDGTGAEATAELSNYSIEKVTITKKGTDYTEAKVTFEAPTGTTDSTFVGGVALNSLDLTVSKIDKENMTEVLEKKKPINIIGVAIEDINSADGVDISITWQYLNTSKDIKYLYFTISPYNCVGDPVKGRYDNAPWSDNGSKIGKIIGPIYGSDERQESHWETFWYNRSICSIKIVKVKVEYMDGSNYTYVKELNKISSPYLKYYSF